MSTQFDDELKNDVVKLRDHLDGNDPDLRKLAARQVIAIMRGGENVQHLFASMLRCVKTSDTELKKLTYLYLANYSTDEPEQAIMAVNTFIQDSQDPNPFIRALAVRTMCRIRLESVAEHMIIPLKKSLSDSDPYVRKTAVFGVVKLYDFIPEAVENARLFADVLALLRDDNPMVVSNTTAAIFEINERRTAPIFALNSETIGPLLNAVNSCSEWCQVILFDALTRYKPDSHDEAQFLIDRLIPFLKHANPAVVLGSFRCIFLFMEADSRSPLKIFPQVIPPFITLVSSADPEVQYVILRTLSLFVQKYPKIFGKLIRTFFCKYNDPSYVKMQKLDIIVAICKRTNAQLVVDELSEYCNAVDVAFVRKAVRAIGQIAIKISESARRCVDILAGLVGGKAQYATEEAVCVVCDLLRKYPGQFESILISVCKNLDSLKDPRARAAGVWILGEYSRVIDSVDTALDPFLDTFHDEQPIVQLALVSALVKVYCENQDAVKDQLQFVLSEASKRGNAPDVRNRALVYWRLLSADVNLTKDVLTFSKQTVVHSGVRLEPAVLQELLRNMGTVAGVLQVVPSDFVRRVRFVPEDEEGAREDDAARVWHAVRLNDSTHLDLFADYERGVMHLRIVSKAERLTDFAFALNRNAVGLFVREAPSFPPALECGDFAEVAVALGVDASQVTVLERPDVQLALRTNVGSVFGVDRVPGQIATLPEGEIGQEGFRQRFQAYRDAVAIVVDDAAVAADQQLAANNVFVVGKNGNKTYVSFAFPGNQVFVAELTQERQSISVGVKGPSPQLFPVIEVSARALFAQNA